MPETKKFKTMTKLLPKIMSDEEAESLLSEDLSEYLTPENFQANFTPVAFEFLLTKTINRQTSSIFKILLKTQRLTVRFGLLSLIKQK
ncbi:MAG: hypothetical protein ACKN9E_02620 [Microcystaceae cyanobacterium]